MSGRQKQQLADVLRENAKDEQRHRALDALDQSALNKMRARKICEAERDEQLQAQLKAEAEERIRNEEMLAEEERVAQELYRRHCHRINDEKMRQQIRENNQELRELEIRLRAAYVGKAIKAQLAEREVEKLKDKLELQKEQDLLNENRAKDRQQYLLKKEADVKAKLALRQDLQNQIINRRLENQRLYEEFLREKKVIDDVVKAILEEQMEWVFDTLDICLRLRIHCFQFLSRDMRKKLLRRDQFRSDIETIRKDQEMWRERNRREIEEENQRIAAYHKENEERARAIQQMEIEKRKHDEALRDKMCAVLDEIEVSEQYL